MPEPYKFPPLPNYHVQTRNTPLYGLNPSSGRNVIMSVPSSETNFVGFVLVDGKEVFRYAFVCNDNGENIIILEDGKQVSRDDLMKIVKKICGVAE